MFLRIKSNGILYIRFFIYNQTILFSNIDILSLFQFWGVIVLATFFALRSLIRLCDFSTNNEIYHSPAPLFKQGIYIYPVRTTYRSANSFGRKNEACHHTRKREYGTWSRRKSTRSTEDEHRLLFPWGQRRSRKCGSPSGTVDVYLCSRWPPRSNRCRDRRRSRENEGREE